MTTKTSALERELKDLILIGSFKGFQIWARENRRALYDVNKREVCLNYNEDDDICEYINKWEEIKRKGNDRR